MVTNLMDSISERQLSLIASIEKVTGHGFDGTTYQQACEFIDEWLDEYELMVEVGK